MLNPRLEKFYKQIICEDFIVLYNITNIAKLPKIERAVLSSRSSNFGKSKSCVLQSFCAWQIATTQKNTATRARKSIAFFNIRKDMLLGLKVTLRKKSLFFIMDKVFTFVLPKVISKSYQSKKALPSSNSNSFKNNHLGSQQSFLKQEKRFQLQNDTISYLQKTKKVFDNQDAFTKILSKPQISELPFFINKKSLVFFNDYLLEKTNDSSYKNVVKSSRQKLSKPQNDFTIASTSSLSFPEISSLSPFFDLVPGFSLVFKKGPKKFNKMQSLRLGGEDYTKNQLLSAFGLPNDF